MVKSAQENIMLFQVKNRDMRQFSAILLGGFLFLCTSTVVASILFGLSSSKTIESAVKMKTVIEGNKFLFKKDQDM